MADGTSITALFDCISSFEATPGDPGPTVGAHLVGPDLEVPAGSVTADLVDDVPLAVLARYFDELMALPSGPESWASKFSAC